MARRGRLITIEGIDGAGKTTLADGLVAALGGRGIPITLLREPGGVVVSERVRDLVKDPGLTVGARTEALLYAAARAQLVEEALVPRLDAGTWVLLDRFVDSSLAYQGGGRELGIERIRELNAFATGGLVPDRTLLLSVGAAEARARAHGRADSADRLEREDDDFFGRISEAYVTLAAAEPERIRTIDAGLGPDEVLGAALEAIRDLLAP
jgi:dTMP kinase